MLGGESGAPEALADENAELKGEVAILRERLDDRDARLQELEEVASKVEFPGKERWSKGKPESTERRLWGQSLKKPEGAPLNLGEWF